MMFRTLRVFTCSLLFWLSAPVATHAQQAYFVDGYHGGKWGHYPEDYTGFMLAKLDEFAWWKLNLEIEPETWDWVKDVDPDNYARFSGFLADAAGKNRIEVVNPAYGQPYMFNIAGESIIRQLAHGIRHTNRHFPSLRFLTYASEEPCFTSALPQLLVSFGFKYASLKNPNTCWGGYVRAHGNDLVNWIGPDGTAIITSPRYAMEDLKPGSTWETIGNYNSRNFVQRAFASGVQYPLGMCLQDAGWRNGPWLGAQRGGYQPTEHVLWRDYFEYVIPRVAAPSWRVSQEDIRVSLVWGAQVLQRIARQVRHAENSLLAAERSAAMDAFFDGVHRPAGYFDTAWQSLFLAQHHDCWIVPYNRVDSFTWAGKVTQWTGHTHEVANRVVHPEADTQNSNDTRITVRNTLPYPQTGPVTRLFPAGFAYGNLSVATPDGVEQPTQWHVRADGQGVELVFLATVPAMGDAAYELVHAARAAAPLAAVKQVGSTHVVETDLYRIVLDTLKGGVITSLRSRSNISAEWVDTRQGSGFNELRGYFYDQQAFRSSADSPATLTVIENGDVRFRLAVNGTVAGHPFTQELTLVRDRARIDFDLTIDWKHQPHIGQYEETAYRAENLQKAFYDDRYKLLLLFPTASERQRITKNAPFDVTESALEDTFFSRWDSIKNNIILDWVDVLDVDRERGLALFTDHTTSYVHGRDHPLGLTVQYAGKGLWGRDYGVEGPTRMAYSLLPHRAQWDRAQLWQEDDRLKFPLVASQATGLTAAQAPLRSMLRLDKPGYQVTALYAEGDGFVIRLFNAASDETPLTIALPRAPSNVRMEELDGRVVSEFAATPNGENEHTITVAMPRFGVRTIRMGFTNNN